MTTQQQQCEVVLVGCGAPGRGMGWYHAEQLLKNKCPSAILKYIVEPWFLGAGTFVRSFVVSFRSLALSLYNLTTSILYIHSSLFHRFTFRIGATGPGGPEFTEYKERVAKDHGVEFLMSLSELPPNTEQTPRLALISGRTADNPKLLNEAIQNGCTCIYLEKPGAPTVAELESMRDVAAAANVPVCMGYNKNVCKFVSKAREYAKENGGTITFVSNNTYENTPESLGECFERNAEGMLKNMAIHELALLVSFYDVTVENIESCVADPTFSSCQTLAGPSSGKEFTDFDKIKFTITTKTGQTVSVQADRCGGDTSYAKVEDSTGNEVFRHSMPDEDDLANVAVLEQEYPGAMVRFIRCIFVYLHSPIFVHSKHLWFPSFPKPHAHSHISSVKIPTILPSRNASRTFVPMAYRRMVLPPLILP